VFDYKTDSTFGYDDLQVMQSDSAKTKIPSVFISLQNGDALLALLQRQSAPSVNVMLQPTRVVAWLGNQKVCLVGGESPTLVKEATCAALAQRPALAAKRRECGLL
jgi:hypothetical protein